MANELIKQLRHHGEQGVGESFDNFEPDLYGNEDENMSAGGGNEDEDSSYEGTTSKKKKKTQNEGNSPMSSRI